MSLLRFEDLAPLRRAFTRSIVWTNGCFDLFHAGHLLSLTRARGCGDLLVVGLNSDESVAGLKPGRPIIPAADRAALLLGLRCVDHVVIFSEPDPLACIEQLQPDVLAKGADYRCRPIIGRDVVEARGGRVELLPLHAGLSTSEIIRRCRESS